MLLRSLTAGMAAALAVAGSSFATADSFHRTPPSDFAREALVNLLARSHNVVEEHDEFSFDTGSCVYAGFVKVHQSVSLERTLEEGKTYMFIAGGDDDATDVDIQVIKDGEVVAEDTMDDNIPYVGFKPGESGDYILKVTLHDAETDSFVGLCCLSTDGWKIPIERLDSAIDNILSRVDAVTESRLGTFLATPNSWCIFGGVLESDSDSFIIDGLDLKNPPYLVVGAADDESADLDLHVFQGDEPMGEDTEDDNVPVVALDESGTYRVQLSNEGEPSLSMFTILDLGTD